MTGRDLYVFIYNTGTMVRIVWVTGANISHYVTKIYWATNLLTTSRCCVIVIRHEPSVSFSFVPLFEQQHDFARGMLTGVKRISSLQLWADKQIWDNYDQNGICNKAKMWNLQKKNPVTSQNTLSL